jgi:hypothetical protein
MRKKSSDDMNDQINITYTPATGDIEFTTARKTSSLDEAVAAIGDYITRLNGGETKKVLKPAQEAKQEAAPKPRPKATKPKQARNGRHRWTDDEKREAMRMYAAGEDLDIIVKKFNSTPGSVEKIMQRNGIKRPWPTRGNPSKIDPVEPADEEEPV